MDVQMGFWILVVATQISSIRGGCANSNVEPLLLCGRANAWTCKWFFECFMVAVQISCELFHLKTVQMSL
jgi:hypothetical protein